MRKQVPKDKYIANWCITIIWTVMWGTIALIEPFTLLFLVPVWVWQLRQTCAPGPWHPTAESVLANAEQMQRAWEEQLGAVSSLEEPPPEYDETLYEE